MKLFEIDTDKILEATSKGIDEAIQNKSNLYELIIEKIEQGSFFEIEGFKCFCLKRKELRKGDFIWW